MKRITILLILAFSGFVFAQENSQKKYDITKLPNYSYLKTKIDLSNIETNPDTMPEFPNGINAFRDKFTKKIDLFNVKFENNRTLKTQVYFVVEKDGKINNIIAIGDIKYSEAAEKAVKKIKDIWKPATLNGEPVRYLFNWPLQLMDH
ncbi:MAG: hypothetical protein WBY99_01595 [Kaistella sp.]